MNNVGFRPTCNVIVSRSTANDFLSNSKSEVESVTSKYYEIIATASKYTGYTADITIANVFDRISDTFGDATAILGSITSYNADSGASAVDTSTIAGETISNSSSNKEQTTNIEVGGLAVFKGDTLVGELDSLETLSHLIVLNQMEECVISIPSPFDTDSVIDLYLTLDNPTKNKVEFVGGAPYISSKIKLNAKILSSEQNSNYFEGDNLSLIEEYATSYMSSQINDYFYKISKELNSDIDLFGRYAVKYFPTWDKWLEYDWRDNFKNAFFDTQVEVTVLSSYLIS